MDLTIITSDHFQPVPWSGGTTTELFIFPPTASYSQRNFEFRLSTAKVETDYSEFTLLKGVSRKLMVLEGKITLNHKDHYSRQLNKFDVDEFDGGWKTSSVGKCTDFNLMTSGKTSGELGAIAIERDQSINYKLKESCNWFFIYLFSGKACINTNKIITTINKGDLLMLSNLTTGDFKIKGIDNSELVFSEVNL